ncbi:UvrD-helicase domain-containing protein [Oerskovia sp. M15]
MTDLIMLDDSQQAAVEVVAGTRQVVVAGPGSGKTEVVSALIDRLIEEEGVDPDDGILVVSFSNAAVHAADARRRRRGAEPVVIMTLDSSQRASSVTTPTEQRSNWTSTAGSHWRHASSTTAMRTKSWRTSSISLWTRCRTWSACVPTSCSPCSTTCLRKRVSAFWATRPRASTTSRSALTARGGALDR